MSSTRVNEALKDLTAEGGALDLGYDAARLIVCMLRMLAAGAPIPADDALAAATELGIQKEAARAVLATWTERNEAGDIIGLGLSQNPTPHQVTVGDGTMWAWCAMDTLVFARILGTPLEIESVAPGTGDTVRLQATPVGARAVDPADAVITWPARSSDKLDFSATSAIWGTFCHHSFFFPSRVAAEEWARGREDIEVMSLDEATAVAEQVAAALMRHEPRQYGGT